jgi:hypothetical protein
MARPEGYLTISSIRDAKGDLVSAQEARERGWIRGPKIKAPEGWGIGADEVPMGHNLVVDVGRQLVCYAMGGLSPYQNNIIQNFGAGTGLATPNALDVQLTSPLPFSSGSLYKPVDSCSFPVPFMVQVQVTIDAASMNGNLITELGLFSANNQMIAHKLRSSGYNKTSDSAPTWLWRIRF